MNKVVPNYIFCSTAYVMNTMGKFLLFKHPKLKKWVPPGGKIEPYEMPQDAAIRECFEETGIQIHLIGTPSSLEKGLLAPQGLEYNPAEGIFKAHLDFIYFGKTIENHPVGQGEGEVQWFSLYEISQTQTFPSIFKWCTKLFNLNER